MFKNFIISALRNIGRNKFYAFLNILGLSVGLTAFVFILLYVRDEMTFDKHNSKYDRIVRIESHFNISNKNDRFAIVPIPMGPAFKLEFPEVEQFVRFNDIGNTLFKYGDKEYYEEGFYFTDSTVFELFDHEFIYGSPEKALTEPFTVVFTESLARKYFGEINPIGEIIQSGSGRSYKVTAVISDQPGNTHLKYDALVSNGTLEQLFGAERFNSMEPVSFWNIGVYTYLLLNENSSMKTIYEKFPAFYEKYMKSVGDQFNASFDLLYTPLKDTHFSTGLDSDRPTGNRSYIIIFSAIAIFILLLAMINYMNMATARSANRAREVGMRKVVGAFRNQLVNQFIGESVLMAVIALIIALIAVIAFLPDFNQLSGKAIHLGMFFQPGIFLLVIAIAIIVGIVSGSYPAFYLSSFRPISVLKSETGGTGKKGGWMRRALVVIQFFIAIFMIISTLIVSDQLNFIRKKDLGFKRENLVVMELQDSSFRANVETFKRELMTNPNILGATNSTGVPGQINWIQVIRVEREDEMADNSMILAQVDYDFVKVLGIEITDGRDFDRTMGTDSTQAVLINETGVKALGWEGNPIGKKIHYGIDLEGNVNRPMKVVGVFKDFNFRSMHNKIEPLILFISPVPRYFLTVRINPDNEKEALAFIEEKWNEFGAKRPFDYNYLSSSLDEMYEAEHKLGVIFRITTGLTIFIALLGLLGLSSFIAERKSKEIGIRKVLGASLGNITSQLYREFIPLIVIGFILAVPVAWWRLDIWLKDSFVYHISIGWTAFIIGGVLALFIGLATISYHIIRAASANPVDAIKYE